MLALLGENAADEHWVVCRTRHDYSLPGLPDLKVINGFEFDAWFDVAPKVRRSRR